MINAAVVVASPTTIKEEEKKMTTTITRERIEKALETLKRTYEEILLNEKGVERENLLSFYRRQIEETTARLQNIK